MKNLPSGFELTGSHGVPLQILRQKYEAFWPAPCAERHGMPLASVEASEKMRGADLRTLQRALATLGSAERLAQALRVPPADLEDYLAGRKPVPPAVFLAALDVVARGP